MKQKKSNNRNNGVVFLFILAILYGIASYGCFYTKNLDGIEEKRMENAINYNLNFSPSQLELDIFHAINDIRKHYNKTYLEYDLRQSYVARAYSQKMLEEGFFDHYDKEGRNVDYRLKEANISYSLAGENLALVTFNKDLVNKTIDGWLNSEKHRETMLSNNFTKLGVGIACGKQLCYITTIYLNKTFVNVLSFNIYENRYLIVGLPLNGPALVKLKFDNNVELFLTSKNQTEKIKNGETFTYYKKFNGKVITLLMQKDDMLVIYSNETTTMIAEIIEG
ncbi:MAG: CAP domain-containing protein [Candidatus Anstonellales archaeon]